MNYTFEEGLVYFPRRHTRLENLASPEAQSAMSELAKKALEKSRKPEEKDDKGLAEQVK